MSTLVDRLQTRVRSRGINFLASEGFAQLLRRRARLLRRLRREGRAVHYFHQVDDPHSHLAVQKLDALRGGYDLPFESHLVSAPATKYQGDSERFEAWARRDARSIAAGYGVTFEPIGPPPASAVHAANEHLAAIRGHDSFAGEAFAVGESLWAGRALPDPGRGTAGVEAVREGNALRTRLGHYLGGTCYFEGEWFWGIDRLRSLEQRLRDEGIQGPRGRTLVPEPTPLSATGAGASGVLLEYFPSLRSPYTAVGHAGVMDLIQRSGVTAKLRPVMPMMMRGVPAPRAKQLYIITDAAREARARHVPFGRIVDPFGPPVVRAFDLYAGAVALGRGDAFVTAYLSAAWAEGVDITRDAGLRQVTERAGLDWSQLLQHTSEAASHALLEENLSAMLDVGLWGVPSFRVSGGNTLDAFACWGQDRLWRIEDEIARRAT